MIIYIASLSLSLLKKENKSRLISEKGVEVIHNGFYPYAVSSLFLKPIAILPQCQCPHYLPRYLLHCTNQFPNRHCFCFAIYLVRPLLLLLLMATHKHGICRHQPFLTHLGYNLGLVSYIRSWLPGFEWGCQEGYMQRDKRLVRLVQLFPTAHILLGFMAVWNWS